MKRCTSFVACLLIVLTLQVTSRTAALPGTGIADIDKNASK